MAQQQNIINVPIAFDVVDGMYQLRVGSSPSPGAPGGSSSSPLYVTIAPVDGLYERPQVTPVISTSIYAAGDVVGGLIDFDVTHPYGGGLINALGVVDDDPESAAFSVYLFDSAPTVIADQAVFATAITLADVKKMINPNLTPVQMAAGDYTTINGIGIAVKPGLNIPYAGNHVYAYFVPTGTPTWTTAADLTFWINLLH